MWWYTHAGNRRCSRYHGGREREKTGQGLAQPPATSTHSARQLPSLPSTSTMSVSQRQRQPTPFSLGASHVSQYWSSSILLRSSSVVISRLGLCGCWWVGA